MNRCFTATNQPTNCCGWDRFSNCLTLPENKEGVGILDLEYYLCLLDGWMTANWTYSTSFVGIVCLDLGTPCPPEGQAASHLTTYIINTWVGTLNLDY